MSPENLETLNVALWAEALTGKRGRAFLSCVNHCPVQSTHLGTLRARVSRLRLLLPMEIPSHPFCHMEVVQHPQHGQPVGALDPKAGKSWTLAAAAPSGGTAGRRPETASPVPWQSCTCPSLGTRHASLPPPGPRPLERAGIHTHNLFVLLLCSL